jgi:hypothetical protein
LRSAQAEAKLKRSWPTWQTTWETLPITASNSNSMSSNHELARALLKTMSNGNGNVNMSSNPA